MDPRPDRRPSTSPPPRRHRRTQGPARRFVTCTGNRGCRRLLCSAQPAPACVDGGGILHVFPNTCVRQQAWVVADERVPEDADDSDDEYVPPGWEDRRVEHEKEGRQGCEWLGFNAYPDSETSSNSEGFLHVGEDGEHTSEDGVEGDQSYDRETVLQMFRAGLEGDFLLHR